MSISETSSELNINMYDKKGKINNKSETRIKTEVKKSSDTDYYMNLLANDNKTVLDKHSISSESDIINSDSSIKNISSVKSTSSKKSKRGVTPPPLFIPSTQSERHNIPVEPMKNPNSQEVRMRKIELLRRLSEIKSKGFSLTKEYNFNSSIDEMEYEYELLKSFADKRNGIKIYKNILLNGVSIIEFVNDKYDPFDFHLQGWGEHMSVEVDSYDDVLEELYEKYKGTGKSTPPELKLLFLIIASASAFHFTKSQTTIPGLDKILTKNPDLISRLINPKKQNSQFMSEQELNIQKQRDLIQQKEKEFKQQQNEKVMREPVPANQSSNKILSNGVPEIRVPPNVQDILNRIKNVQANTGNTDTQDETSSNNDRLISDTNISNKKNKKSKPSISVSTK
jgi:hypothetical protein